jgi:seryl-tRNA synthetase
MAARGYTPMSVPLLMRDEAMQGTGYYPGAEEQTYRMEKDELNLAGTAEVPLTAYRMGEILAAEELPLKFVAMSSCFRREAGAAGKDTYGLYRIHQFDKVEQVVICENNDETSKRFHDEILANAEGVMQALGLPYRIVVVCTGDLGRGQAKKFDIEAWMPSRGNYCETHSASKFYDFQARRMNLRYKDAQTKKNVFCHTLNNTVIASPRVLIPLMELYQNADGSITIPQVLRPYFGGRERIATPS